jgi:hypothetical protein
MTRAGVGHAVAAFGFEAMNMPGRLLADRAFRRGTRFRWRLGALRSRFGTWAFPKRQSHLS